VLSDDGAVVNIAEHSHQKSDLTIVSEMSCRFTIFLLAIHPIRHSAVTRNAITKVFQVESTFETGGEKPSEGCNEGGKG
jgi:hypothetical protein